MEGNVNEIVSELLEVGEVLTSEAYQAALKGVFVRGIGALIGIVIGLAMMVVAAVGAIKAGRAVYRADEASEEWLVATVAFAAFACFGIVGLITFGCNYPTALNCLLAPEWQAMQALLNAVS